MSQRVIMHVDMDAFYASVEQRDHPQLRGKPLIVGGRGRRGVVAAASYEIRRFGVHSAMPVARARRLCPQAVVVAPRMATYAAESARILDILRRFTPLVEPLSLDEAFLDVSASLRLLGEARSIGERIKADIRNETGLTASVGVAPNKFLAKLASDQHKPDGLCVVDPDRIREFLDPLPVRRMWGVGPKAAARLARLGVATIGDLRRCEPGRLRAALGGQTARLQALARGEDARQVEVKRAEQSVSNEVTFDLDLTERRDCETRLLALSESVGARLRRKARFGRTVFIKVRTGNFRTYTRQKTLSGAMHDDRTIGTTARLLFGQWWREHGPAPIRLLGVGVSSLASGEASLPGAGSAAERLDELKDAVRERFGRGALRPGSLVPGDGDPNRS